MSLWNSEFSDISEYCRVYRMTPQSLLKAGARKIIEEDILEKKADLQTIQSWEEINNGLSEPIDDLVEMIEEDRRGWICISFSHNQYRILPPSSALFCCWFGYLLSGRGLGWWTRWTKIQHSLIWTLVLCLRGWGWLIVNVKSRPDPVTIGAEQFIDEMEARIDRYLRSNGPGRSRKNNKTGECP